MLLKLIFRQFPTHKQVSFLQKRAIMLGTRTKNGRRIHIYMFRNLFVEVLYKNDVVGEHAEQVNMLTGLKNLNSYLESEFKTSF
jgi:hypothetical protein